MTMRSLSMSVLVILAVLLAACSTTREQYVKRGNGLLLSRDYPRAALEFKNALKRRPNDAELHHLLGEAYLGMRQIAAAVAEYRRAKGLDPNHAESGLRLAQIMAASGDPKILGDALSQAQAAVSERQSSAALDTLALVEMRSGRLDDAVRHLEESTVRTPANLQAATALSGIRLARKDEAGAEKALRDAIHANPRSPAGYVELGRLLERLGRREEAEQQFTSAVEKDPNHAPALLGLAQLQVRAGRTDRADQTYRKLSALPDRSYRPLHALFMMESGRHNEAIQELAKLYQDDSKDRTTRGYLLAAYVRANRLAEASKLLENALAANPKDTDLLLGMSRLHALRRDYAAAEVDLNQVLRFGSDTAVAHYLLSKIHEARNETGLQRQSLGEALRHNPRLLAARSELALLLAATGDAKSALAIMDGAPKFQQTTAEFLISRNWVLMALQDWDGLRAGVQKGLAVSKAPALLLQDGLWKLEKTDFRAARESLEQVLRADPKNLQAMQGVASSYIAEGQPASALVPVREFAAARPDSALAQHLLGKVYLAAGRIPEARSAFQAAKKADPGFADSDIMLAQLDIWAQALDPARQTLARLLAAHPGNAAGHLLMGSVEELSNNISGAIEQYRKAVELAPGNAVAANNLAYLLSSQPGRLDEALGYARRAVSAAPGNMAFQDTFGWILYQKGQPPPDLRYFNQANK